MNHFESRLGISGPRTPILTGQTVSGPVVMLIGGRLTPVRPSSRPIRRAPASTWPDLEGTVV